MKSIIKPKLFSFFVIIIILSAFFSGKSQAKDCTSKTFTGSYFDIDYLTTFPDYDLEMPYEVLLGYVALDTVCYYGDWEEFADFMSRQENNDTLKTIMKHYYHVVDWDPIKFMQSRFYGDTAMDITVRNVREGLDYLIEEKSDNPYLDYTLCHTDIIARVLVTDTVSWVDSASYVGPGVTVQCELIDPIKGKIIPEITGPDPLAKKNNPPEIQKTSADSGKTLIFDYCLGWQRKSDDGEFLTMRDSTGAPWIKEGKEYLVFLNLIVECVDHNIIRYELRTVDFHKSSTGLLYPVENGIVYSPLDDFGFGTGLTVSEFKTALENRINQIKNFNAE